MTGSLARYHARSPRYILDTTENNLVRFSGAQRVSWEEKTLLKNISLTGLSFMAPQDLSPQLGEIIKIQFEVPGSTMMACYAVVTRIELISEFENEIAVHFYKLDRQQRINLVQGLAHKIVTNDTKKTIPAPSKMLTGIAMFTSILIWLTLIKLFLLT